jgi:hypothetical protein
MGFGGHHGVPSERALARVDHQAFLALDDPLAVKLMETADYAPIYKQDFSVGNHGHDFFNLALSD